MKRKIGVIRRIIFAKDDLAFFLIVSELDGFLNDLSRRQLPLKYNRHAGLDLNTERLVGRQDYFLEACWSYDRTGDSGDGIDEPVSLPFEIDFLHVWLRLVV